MLQKRTQLQLLILYSWLTVVDKLLGETQQSAAAGYICLLTIDVYQPSWYTALLYMKWTSRATSHVRSRQNTSKIAYVMGRNVDETKRKNGQRRLNHLPITLQNEGIQNEGRSTIPFVHILRSPIDDCTVSWHCLHGVHLNDI